MITYKTFVEYNTVSSRDTIEDWLNDDNVIYSNRNDFAEKIEQLNDYKESVRRNYGKKKEKKVYTNIWAHYLRVMIPLEFQNIKDAKKFVTEYMVQVSSCYKERYYLYCYKFLTKGKGMYAEIICWTRKIYDIPETDYVKYQKDYWWNPITKKMAKKNSENAVLLHRKGDLKLDHDGNKIEKKLYVAPVEKEIFKYKYGKINSLTRWLRSIVNDVRLSLIRTVDMLADTYKKFISLVSRKKDVSNFWIARKYLKNNLISKINCKLLYFQNALYDGYMLDSSIDICGWEGNLKTFNTLIYKIDKLCHSKKISAKKTEYGAVVEIFIDLTGKQSFVSYREELEKLKEYIDYLLDEWWISVVGRDTTGGQL